MKYWTPDEIAYLREHVDNCSDEVLGLIFGVSATAVKGTRKRNEIKRADDGKFKKGHTPANKGQSMPANVYAKAKRTMFKKGQIPHNKKAVGEIWQYRESSGRLVNMIKPADDQKAVYHSRYVWERAYGPIPKGMYVSHKDGNSLNDALDNLELLTMSENLEKNNRKTVLIAGEAIELRSASDIQLARQLLGKQGWGMSNEDVKNLIEEHPQLIELYKTKRALTQKIKDQNHD